MVNDYVIIHRGNCWCVSGGFIQDRAYADDQCGECDEAFGFGIPIVIDDGLPRAHLSCVLAYDLLSTSQ